MQKLDALREQQLIKTLRTKLRPHRWQVLFMLATWGSYCTVLFSRLLSFKNDGLYAGHEHVWSDWALHIGMVKIFASRSPLNWFAHHPLYANGKFTYGFLTNFISGMLLRIGLPLDLALLLPSVFYCILLIIGLYFLAYQLLQKKNAAVVAVCLFFLSSGLGFVTFIGEFIRQPSVQALAYPARYFSRIDQYDYYSGNIWVGLLVPQRAFLLGMTVGVISLNCLLYGFAHLRKRRTAPAARWWFLAAGVSAGILPITHMHSFIVMIILGAVLCFTQLKWWKNWLWYVVPAGIFSCFLYFVFISGGIETENFMQVLIGWTVNGNVVDWLMMWWRLWGLTIPVALMGIGMWCFSVYQKKPLRLPIGLTVSVGFISIFLLANIVLFQPIRWDNTKLFFWSYFGFSLLAAYFLDWLWKWHHATKVIAMMIFFVLTGTGYLELIRLQRVQRNSYQMLSNEQLQLGEVLQNETAETAVFATATDHNHFVMMWAARPILLGYTAWAYNFGFEYHQREVDLKSMYEGGPNVFDLLQKYEVDYLVIGPSERANYQVHQAFFDENFPLAFSTPQYRIYQIR